MEIPYATITSTGLRLATMALATLPRHAAKPQSLGVRVGTSCEILSPTRVRCGDGAEIDGQVVIDCRGRAAAAGRQGGAGYQTFIGHEYRLGRRWPAVEPTVMDVREDQAGGFEFLYELPFGPDHVLLEYTRFHEEPTCDRPRAERLIAARLAEAGMDSAELIRS